MISPDPVLHAGYLAPSAADDLFSWCLAALSWHEERLHLYGRSVCVPRLMAHAGESGVNYRYSGTDHVASGWPRPLQALVSGLNTRFQLSLNHGVFNRYRGGMDHMGWHTDDERGVRGLVWVLSLGATRRLRWRRQDTPGSFAIDLEHGSLLALDGRCTHRLTPTRRAVGERVSLTFREIVA